MQTLISAVATLDHFLTRRPYTVCLASAQRQLSQPDPLFGREYYLSDGGYSRIVFGVLEEHLFLTSNSRPEVAALWQFAKELVADVESALIATFS